MKPGDLVKIGTLRIASLVPLLTPSLSIDETNSYIAGSDHAIFLYSFEFLKGVTLVFVMTSKHGMGWVNKLYIHDIEAPDEAR